MKRIDDTWIALITLFVMTVLLHTASDTVGVIAIWVAVAILLVLVVRQFRSRSKS